MNSSKKFQIKAKAVAFDVACVVLCLAFALSLNCVVLASTLSDEYLSEEKWQNQSNFVTLELNKKCSSNNLNGVLKYFSDKENNTFYSYFSINESSLNDDSQDANVIYKFNTDRNVYNVVVNKDGIVNTYSYINQCFKAIQSFDYRNNFGKFMLGIEYFDNDINSVDIYLNVNGYNYLIIENIDLSYNDDLIVETTTRYNAQNSLQTTKKQNENLSTTNAKSSALNQNQSATRYNYNKNSKTTKEIQTNPTTAKSNIVAQNSNSAQKATVLQTNKAHYSSQGESSNDLTNKSGNSNSAMATDSQSQLSYFEAESYGVKNSYNTRTKILFSIAGALVIAGVVFIMLSIISKRKSEEIKETENTENVENEK